MNYADLRSLIDAEPLNAARTDQQVLDLWWKPNVTVQTDVSWTEFALWMVDVGGRQKFEAALPDPDDSVKNAAQLAIDIIRAGRVLELSRNDVRATFGPLVGTGKTFTAAERNALLAKSDVTMPRWQAESYDRKDDASWLYHIARARAL